MILKSLDSKMKCPRKTINGLESSFTNAPATTLLCWVSLYIDRNSPVLNMTKTERVDMLHYRLNHHFATVREFLSYCVENYGFASAEVVDLELN
jgi:hypothetical protein